ncbi:pilus assembly protein TadG-related protein [Microbacterium sp. zg-Y818]|uniref:pilus assembly protein TadG-related protein n=1 Tax=unclassified Microbacterium TaxID=2609290 RepID=UPI00214ACE72|nr:MULTISPECIES: pilus assembly protein TadG-related protein [unclassified Microbacterium]MCR2801195.1 pilus assembly protein TadG-related protein [Microbacterium sp. zg.Y818]WIM21030.1 pilus assembly protein TadG-related protein [Microbacterium sp. zg-Y818]
MTTRQADDDGSIMLLSLGYAVLAILLILVCVDATSLHLASKRLDAVADAAALAGADGFTLSVDGGEPTAQLTDAGVHEQAAGIVSAVGTAVLVSAATPDGVSARVTVSTVWHPPIATLLVPAGVPLESTATSRTALR